MAIGRITGQMLSTTLNRNTTDLTFATDGDSSLLVLDATNDRIGIGTASPTVQFETTGSALIGTDLTVTGNLTVNGSTTTINTTNLTVDDKNIELAHSLSGQAPTDAVADGGGIILKGDTDHTILWSNANNSWDFSENVSVATGSAFQINNSNVLDANNLTLENIQIAGNVITSSSNADISLQPSGTGKVVIEGIQIDGTVITGVDSTVISFGGNQLSGVGDPTQPSDVSTKSYVDSQVSAISSTLGFSDSSSNTGSVVVGTNDLEFRSGDSLTLTVAGNGVTASLNDNITVNQIGAKDSTAVSITSPLQVTGALQTSSSLQIAGSTVITAILDEDTMSSDSASAIPTQQSVKAYVDSQITATNSLTLGDDASSEITLNLDDVLNVKGGNSVTSSVAGDSLTFGLDANITVNQIGALDSTAINITSPVYVTGALNTDTSLQIAGSTVITSILDEDNFASNSDTALATQQSIKAYVDANAGGNLKIGDSASTESTVSVSSGQALEFRSGDSITLTVSGNGVTADLNETISVDTITAGDSTAITMGSPVILNSTLKFNGDAQAITQILDEDNFASNSATALATQQSIKAYVDAVAQGLHVHASVHALTNTPLATITGDTVAYNNGSSGVGATLTLSTALDLGGGDIDGDTDLQVGDRIIVNGESTAAHNGIYVITSTTILTRATDFDTPAEMAGGDFVFVTHGTLYADTGWVLGEPVTTVGSDAVDFIQFSGAGAFTAGDGLTLTGTEFSVNVDSSTIEINADTLRVKDAGITNVKLANSTITVVGDDSTGTAVSLGETFKIAGGESLNASVTADTLTINLDDDITVNQIGAKDSSAVSITSALQTTSIQSSGNVNVNGTFTLGTGSGVTTILDEDTLSSDSDTALATQQSIKAYVDSQVAASNTLTLGDDASSEISLNLDDVLNVKGGNSITSSVSGDSLTFSLNDTITVNQIGALDSTAVSITSPLQATSIQTSGNVDVNGLATIGSVQISGNVITSTDSTQLNFGQMQLTDVADPTQASDVATKSYVDSQTSSIVTTIGISDSASNSSTLTLGVNDLEFRSGDSITPAVAGTGVTFNLNDNITVNQIGAKDSTAVSITSATQIDGTLQVSGASTLNGDITIASGSITSASGSISFDNENLTTTGNITGADIQATGNLQVDGNLTVSGTTTSVNSTNITVSDPMLILSETNSGGADVDSGIMIERGSAGNNAAFYWNEGDDRFKAVLTTSDGTTTSVTDSSYATVNLGGLVFGAESVVITSILDEDTMSSNSDTALATQQSIKAYVDSVSGGTITLGDSASNSGSVNVNGAEELVFRSGDSITMTVSGNGVTTALNDNITVNQIGAKDSTAVSITSPLQVTGNIQSSGDIKAGTSFTIGSASLTEAELEKLDEITNGTGAANKALVLDASQDITSGVNVFTATTGDFQTVKVNTIESDDSTAVTINDGLIVTGNFEFDGGVAVNTILDEDNFASNSATALATQQSIKAYVDSVAGGTITLGDSASNAGSVDINAGQDLEFRAGNSITPTVSGNGVTIALDSNITVNSITSADSSFVKINDSLETEAAQINQTLTVDGDAQIKGNLTVQGTTTYIETTNTKVSDPLLLLNNGNSGGADIDSGIMVERGSAGNNAVFYWNEGDDKFKAVLTTSDESATTITDTATATIVANLEGNSVTVNQIGANDSSAIDITSPVYITGALNTDTSLQIAGSTVIDGILDEDNFASNSATKLATQQSIKAYVDAVAGGTITLGDSASNAGSVDINAGQDLEFRSGDSITATVSGNGVTFDLNETISVDTITAGDSTSITIQNNTFVNGYVATNELYTNVIGNRDSTAVSFLNNRISEVGIPTAVGDAATKGYVDDQTITVINDISNVDANEDNLVDGDILVHTADSGTGFTLASQINSGMRLPSGNTAARPTIYSGVIRYNTETGKYEGSTDGSTWNAFAMEGTAETLNKDVFTGDGGATYNFSNVTTPLAGSGSNGATGLIVYIDNVLQEPTQNYTITNTAITFDSVVHSGARIVVIQGFDGGAGGGASAGLTTTENTDVDSAIEQLDVWALATYRAAKYTYRIENADTSEYQAGEILVVHDGSAAYFTEYAKVLTGNNDLITFSVGVGGGNVILNGSANTPNSNFRAKRINLEVA